MRLLIATPLYPPESGGPATYSKALEDGLPSRGIEVELVKFSDVRDKPVGIRHALYAWEVFKKAKRADAVLALDPVSVGVPASFAALLAKKPLFVKIVGDYAWEQGRQRYGVWQALDDFVRTDSLPWQVLVLRAVETFVARGAKRIIVPSEYLKRIVTAWGIAPEKISVIYNAEPAKAPGALPESIAGLARPRIVSAGRLVPWKGMHGLIAAMQTIRAKVPTAELVIVGDGPERQALERYAKVRLGEGIVTFTGRLANDETLAVMQDADIFVLNSSYEGLSHILLEALHLGAAIVATRAGGNPEVIEQGNNGLLISVGDPQALADACLALIADEAGRQTLKANAKASAARFAPERMLEATSAFFAEHL